MHFAVFQLSVFIHYNIFRTFFQYFSLFFKSTGKKSKFQRSSVDIFCRKCYNNLKRTAWRGGGAMNYSDKAKLERLANTVEINCRVTRMYADYLERYPEVITADMVNALTEDGVITREEAIVAILSELFGLDMQNGPEDRRIIMDYLTPSVRILHAIRYTENPYYKNVKIENVKDGAWELRREHYEPYRAIVAGDMMIDGYKEVAPLGFFPERFDFPAVLEDGNEWMTLTPVDLDTCDEAIEAAHGKVVTFGLGLGYYAYMTARKPEVDSITVIEKSPEVIRLFEKHILPYFENPEKLRIICADAFEYAEHEMPSENYDFAFVDTWRDASDGAPMYEKMCALEHLSSQTRFKYWIENFLISRIRYLRFCEIYDSIESGAVDAPSSFAEVENLLSLKREK